MALNNCIFVGRIAQDPEVKTTQSGVTIANFSVAVDRAYSKGDEKKCDFIPVVTFNKTAEFVEKWFKKGTSVHVTGRLEIEPYTDKDGNKKYSYKIVSSDVGFAGSKSDSEGTKSTTETANYTEIPETDLPFSL